MSADHFIDLPHLNNVDPLWPEPARVIDWALVLSRTFLALIAASLAECLQLFAIQRSKLTQVPGCS